MESLHCIVVLEICVFVHTCTTCTSTCQSCYFYFKTLSICYIDNLTVSLSEKSLKLRWMATGEHRPVVKNEDVELPQFTITNVNIRNESRTRRDRSK